MTEKPKSVKRNTSTPRTSLGSQGIRRVPLKSALEGDKVEGIKRPSPRNHPSRKELEIRVHEETQAIEREIINEKKGNRWLRVLFIILLLGGVGLGLTQVFARAEVSVVPKKQTVPVSLAATAYDRPGEGQLRFETLTKTITKEVVLTATDTEYREVKAFGKIRIFNNYSTSPQTFIEETRFMASDGKIYKTGKGVRVTVPGKKGSTPGFVDATVYAAEPGSAYNKDLDDFTIPGFQGSPKYTGFTARSLTPMAGGFQGTAALVSQSSIDTALVQLKTQLQEDLISSVRQQTPDTFVTLPGGIIAGPISEDIDHGGGEGVLVRVSKPVTFVLFDRENLTSYLAKLLVSEYQPMRDRLSLDDMNTIRVTVPAAIPEESTQIHVVFDGSATFSWLTEAARIRSAIQGISKRDIPSAILAIPTIENADVTLHPLWLMRVPEKQSRISVLPAGTYEKQGTTP